MRLKRIVALIILILSTLPHSHAGASCVTSRPAEPTPSDSITADSEATPRMTLIPDSVASPSLCLAAATPGRKLDLSPIENGLISADRNWWHLLRRGQLSMQDTSVEYPPFLDFCVNVYRWADKFFNSYDNEYVVSTGHRWKARLVNDNWVDSYAFDFKKHLSMRMLGNMYSNAGAYLHYMAVSVGYSIDLNTIFGGKATDHSRFETNFNCARFNADVYYTVNKGGTYVRQFKGYNNNHLFKSAFPGLELSTFGINLYYFLNHRKYSQGAAYNFSKLQRKSAGSFIVGFTYSNLDISMDFTLLAPELKPHFNLSSYFMKFHYFNYCALFGYGYNWVIHPKWLFNISVMPSIGVNHCYEDSIDGSGNLFSLNIHARGSLTYNYKILFASIIAKINGNWYSSPQLSLFNSVQYFSANVGIRF